MNKKLKQYFSNKNNFIGLGIALLGAVILFPFIFVTEIYPLSPENYLSNSGDPSFILTLNYAAIKNLVWGKDFAFTYGPLAYLAMRIGWGTNKYSFLIYDLFYVFNVFAVFYLSYKRSVNKLIACVLIAATVITMPKIIGGGHALVLFFFLIFWIRLNIVKPHYAYYIIQIILVALMFYIKFNTGFIGIVVYLISLGYIIIFKKQKVIPVLIYAVVPIVLIYILGIVLNVDMAGYITSGLEMVSGYNAIMYITDPTVSWMLYIILLIIFCGAAYICIRTIKEKDRIFENLLTLFLFSLSIYILYKQSYVRGDIWHIFDFFSYCTLLALCLAYFTDKEIKNKLNILVAVLVASPIVMLSIYQKVFFTDFVGKLHKAQYFSSFNNFEPAEGMHLTPNSNQFPANIKQKIGKATVDTYPWNLYMLYENEVNYLPRPVIQSYVAYTKYLEDLNFNHYNSDKAPQYVLYDYMAIDARYPMFDESKMNLVLLKNYTAVDTFSLNKQHIILLEKKKDAKPVTLTFIKEYALLSKSPLLPKKDTYYEVNLYGTLPGKIQSVLTFDAPVSLEIKTKNNTFSQHKTSAPLLATGIFGDVKILNTNDFYKLITNDSIDDSMIISEYYFRTPEKGAFKDKIRIKEYKIN